jgi:hypothetical protein
MESAYMEVARRIIGDPEYNCPVCGSPRYVTNRGNRAITIHCTSAQAKFWECPSGSLAETFAKQHWEQSSRELSLTLDAVRSAADKGLSFEGAR